MANTDISEYPGVWHTSPADPTPAASELPYAAALRLTRESARRQRIAPPEHLPPQVAKNRSGFFNPSEPADDLEAIGLVRECPGGRESFRLVSRIAYLDQELGVLLVPPRGEDLVTDFASVPQIFTWLVPKSGTHLPAALVHDGLIPETASTYVGPPVERWQADRVLRDAMQDLGCGWIRSWLVWTAVSFATEVDQGTAGGAWKTPRGFWILLRLFLFVAVIVGLGTLATFDLFGGGPAAPWMGGRSTTYELVVGGVFAVLVPAALSLVFLVPHTKMVRAALILGVAMALLLHATAFLAALLLLYNAAEKTIASIRGRGPWRAAGAANAVLVAAAVLALSLAKAARSEHLDRSRRMPKLPYAQRLGESIGALADRVWHASGWYYAGVATVVVLAILWAIVRRVRRKPGAPPSEPRWRYRLVRRPAH